MASNIRFYYATRRLTQTISVLTDYLREENVEMVYISMEFVVDICKRFMWTPITVVGSKNISKRAFVKP